MNRINLKLDKLREKKKLHKLKSYIHFNVSDKSFRNFCYRFYLFNLFKLFCIFNLLDHARILDTKMSFHKIFNNKMYEKNKF